MSDLDARLLAAHAARDGRALVALYQEAAERSEDEDASCFFLTQAYVYALESGASCASLIRSQLIAKGREQ